MYYKQGNLRAFENLLLSGLNESLDRRYHSYLFDTIDDRIDGLNKLASFYLTASQLDIDPAVQESRN